MQMSEKINAWFEATKNAVIALASVFGLSITGIGVYNGIQADEVSIDEIKLPASFEEQGYKADITTIRILDGIKQFQSSNSSAKDRVSFFGPHNRDQPTNLQLAGSGKDVKAVQSYVRDSLGMVTAKISGVITARKTDSGTEYHVKIRRTPENAILVDLKSIGSIEDVIHQTALKILEATDPHIAAATYWSMSNESDALRMIDVVLGNDNTNDDKFSLNLRAYINITHKRYEKAQRDIDLLMKIAPDFIPLLSSRSWMAREKGDFTEALKLAEEQIFRAPDKWWGYLARAQAMQGLKRDEDASIAYIKLISMRPEVPNPYLVSGRYFVGKNDYEHATEAFRIGLSKYKDHPILNLTYADILLQEKNYVQSFSIYQRFVEIPKYRLHALIGLCEIFTAQNRNDDLKSHINLLRKFLIEHPMGENEKKLFSNRVKPFFN